MSRVHYPAQFQLPVYEGVSFVYYGKDIALLLDAKRQRLQKKLEDRSKQIIRSVNDETDQKGMDKEIALLKEMSELLHKEAVYILTEAELRRLHED